VPREEINETNAMWREFRERGRREAERTERSRWPKLWALIDRHQLDTRPLGEYGIRIIGPASTVDYWPRTGTLQIVGKPNSTRYCASPSTAVMIACSHSRKRGGTNG